MSTLIRCAPLILSMLVVDMGNSFQYLGINFNYWEIMANLLDSQEWLGRLDKVTLNPYHEYEVLLKFLILRLHFPLTFCRFLKKALGFQC